MNLEKQEESFLEHEKKDNEYWEKEMTRRDFIKKTGRKAAKVGAAATVGGWAFKEIRKMDKQAEEIRKRRRERKIRQEEITKQAWQDEEWVKAMEDFEENGNEFKEKGKAVWPKEKEERQIKEVREDIACLKEKKEKSEAEKLADIYLNVFNTLKNQKEFFPPEIFSADLFIAQQLQESGYRHDAKSHKGAVGVMQNRAISVKDVPRYIAKLKRKNKINFSVPRELSDGQVKEIMKLIARYPNYSRAFGKLYMMMLFDPIYGYGVAKKEWQKNDVRAVQKKVLAAYNGGYKPIKYYPEWRWPRESREYYKGVFHFMKLIDYARQQIKRVEGFKRLPSGIISRQYINYALMKLVDAAAKSKHHWGRSKLFAEIWKKLKPQPKIKARLWMKMI